MIWYQDLRQCPLDECVWWNLNIWKKCRTVANCHDLLFIIFSTTVVFYSYGHNARISWNVWCVAKNIRPTNLLNTHNPISTTSNVKSSTSHQIVICSWWQQNHLKAYTANIYTNFLKIRLLMFISPQVFYMMRKQCNIV